MTTLSSLEPTEQIQQVPDASNGTESMVSIIIVSFNTKDLTRQCLASVREWYSDAHVVVVDNASKDGSAEMVQDEFPEVELITLDRNAGFGGANNIGYERCKDSDYVILLNSDTIVPDKSLQQCIEFMDTHPEIGATSPRLVGMDGQPQQAQHPFPTVNDIFRKAFWKKSLYQLEVDENDSWLAGTCLCVRREAIEQAGGLFEHKLFIYWEDADLSSRLLKAGWKLRVVIDACIRHYGGASGGGPDASRRPDLHTWYTYGRHYWFCQHRPFREYATVCAMDFIDVFRTSLRAAIRKSRRVEFSHARCMLKVLWLRATGRRPKLLGT